MSVKQNQKQPQTDVTKIMPCAAGLEMRSHIRYITPAIKYLNIVIPATPGPGPGAGPGIQVLGGCRIQAGMTGLVYLVAR